MARRGIVPGVPEHPSCRLQLVARHINSACRYCSERPLELVEGGEWWRCPAGHMNPVAECWKCHGVAQKRIGKNSLGEHVPHWVCPTCDIGLGGW